MSGQIASDVNLEGKFQGQAFSAENPLPIGGWLIVMAIYFGVYLLMSLAGVYLVLIEGGILAMVVTVTHVGFRLLALFMCGMSLLLPLVIIANAVLFFRRKKKFPEFFTQSFIWYVAGAALLQVCGLMVIGGFLGLWDVILPLASLLIWGSYLHRSERVKGTFLSP